MIPSILLWRAATGIAVNFDERHMAGEGLAAEIRVHVALMPDVVQVKAIRFPPLKSGEVLGVLCREVGRCFAMVCEPMVVGVDRPRPEGSRVCVAAPAATLDSVLAALHKQRMRLVRFVPAVAAWAAAAPQGATTVVVSHAGVLYLLGVEDGRLALLRCLPARESDRIADAIRTLHTDDENRARRPVLVIGVGFDVERVTELLRAAGHDVHRLEEDPKRAAARLAPQARGPCLVPPSVAAAIHRRTRTATRGLLVASLALFVGGSLLDTWGMAREMEDVRARREALRSRVEPLLEMRAMSASSEAMLDSLRARFAAVPVWNELVFELAAALPDEAHITDLSARDDTLRLVGSGQHAAAALEALNTMPTLQSLGLRGPVRRELHDSAAAVEHFEFAGRVRGPGGGI
jgi:general secretion pathway protein L